MWAKIMRKRSVWAKLPHTTFVVRARNYVTQRAENWNRFNSSSATFRFKLRSATLVANSGSAERSTTGSVSNRSAEGNGRPTSAAMCRIKGATWRQPVNMDCFRDRSRRCTDMTEFMGSNPARLPGPDISGVNRYTSAGPALRDPVPSASRAEWVHTAQRAGRLHAGLRLQSTRHERVLD